MGDRAEAFEHRPGDWTVDDAVRLAQLKQMVHHPQAGEAGVVGGAGNRHETLYGRCGPAGPVELANVQPNLHARDLLARAYTFPV
jgi:hypothetical protein